ncbi:MAG: aminotransferase class I/II-fold pyridoxal phosphate-dependent enzyme [Candidatus Hodarchaeales archaeon]
MELSPNVERIKYAIRDIVIAAKQVEKKGKKLYYFNIGDPDKFDFDTPDYLKSALVEALNEPQANAYSNSAGNPELREEIAKRQKRLWGTNLDPEKILITTGVSEAISFVAASLAPGTEILVPSPIYPSYLSYFKFYNVNPVQYKTDEEYNWYPVLEDIRGKISSKTQAIVIINPNNPTGAVYPPKIVKEIADIAGEHEILIISDEIYDLLSYTNNYKSTASLTDVPVLEFNGISKTMLAPGWRLGWANLRDDEEKYSDFWEALAKQSRIRLCSNSPIQVAVSKILNKPMDFLPDVLRKLKERASYFAKRINEMEGMSLVPPEGAFYAFSKLDREIDDKKFVLELLKETGVLFVFGSGFGDLGKGHFRSVVLPNLEVMKEALDLVEQFLRKFN